MSRARNTQKGGQQIFEPLESYSVSNSQEWKAGGRLHFNHWTFAFSIFGETPVQSWPSPRCLGCSTLAHLFKCPGARIFYKEGSGLEPKIADFQSKEQVSIPNWSSLSLCSKRNEAKNRSIGISSNFCGRNRTRTCNLVLTGEVLDGLMSKSRTLHKLCFILILKYIG